MMGTFKFEELRRLCIKNDWFTCGNKDQYEMLFELNDAGCSIEKLATIIWICSDMEKWKEENIFAILKAQYTANQLIKRNGDLL